MTFEFETLILSDEQKRAENWCRQRGLEMQVLMENNVRYREPNAGFTDAPMKLIRIYDMTREYKDEWQSETRLTPEPTQSTRTHARRGR